METTKNSSGKYATSDSNETENSSQTGNSLNMGNITDMLGGLNIPEALKKYSGTATKAISGLSTTQKVIGGAILLLGASYLTRGSRGGWMKKASALGGLAKMNKGKNKNDR